MNVEVNLDPFREPRGFIKLLEWFFAICAFATCLNFSTDYGFNVHCAADNKTIVHVINKIEYPFELDTSSFKMPSDCPATDIPFVGSAKSDAEYFVATGVLSFLYSMAGAALYLVAEKSFQQNNKVPVIDFFITLVLAVFWLSGSAALAKGISTLQTASDANQWLKDVGSDVCTKNICSDFHSGYFSRLIVSVLFGFINFILWTGNLWFLYKETTWFESIMKGTRPSFTSQSQGV